jgi:Asp-tRNA(Asn)/Glu-tRNA(Gln) amidotransferase A subunit family amidase
MSRRSRRSFLKAVRTALAAGVAAPAFAQPPSPIGTDMLECGETLTGVNFEPAESELMLNLVNANREHFDAIRRVELPSETEPAFSFRPPGPGVTSGKGPALSGVETSRTNGRTAPRTKAARISGARVAARIEDVAFEPAAKLGQLIASRVITSIDLTRMYLDRLKRFDERLECVITLTEALALEQAGAADAEVKAGRVRGPLHGVPYGIKDLFATKGIRTTWGAKPYEDQVFDYDSTTVERLREAGAVLVAKLTTGELAIGDVWFGGRTRNPWMPETGSSGSSAGPAAAVAAGLVGFAIGTETGGSIISPAGTCGVVGLRPSYGRVSRHGVMTLRWTLDKVGTLGRTVEDCALALGAIYGPDGRDATVAEAPFTWTPGAKLHGLRIGYVSGEFDHPSENASADERARWPARRALLEAARDAIRAAGASLEPIDLPDLPAQSLYAILNAEAGAMFDDLVRSGRVRQLAGKGPNHRANQLRASRYIPAVEYIRAQRVRTLLLERMNALFGTIDAFLAPTSSASVTMTNLTGHPAVVLKAGFVDDMPDGIMVTGRLFDEATILRIASAYERATPWKAQHPNMSNS